VCRYGGHIDSLAILLGELARRVGDKDEEVSLFERISNGIHEALIEL
jgi:hypothetical protein